MAPSESLGTLWIISLQIPDELPGHTHTPAAGDVERAEGRVLSDHWSAGAAHGALPTTLQRGLQPQMVYDPEGDGADLAFPLSPTQGSDEDEGSLPRDLMKHTGWD